MFKYFVAYVMRSCLNPNYEQYSEDCKFSDLVKNC